ncbi:tripartite tricarboxylate transporter substrate binding protein [Alcaligenaceae bacterium]|nr:tripartite tricarboxylate transporter substrate binding protein [Alcaligenaceae bacterium]
MQNRNFQVTRRTAFGMLFAVAMFIHPMASGSQAFPSRPIKIIVPASAGGSTDVMARTLAKVITEQNNVTVVVENRAGASGSIGVRATINALPDGYTIMLTLADATTIFPLTRKVPPYNTDKDLTPLAQVAWTNVMFSVSANTPYKSLKEFVDASQTKQMAYSSNGHGTNTHLWMELFKEKSGAKLMHVPYKGAAPSLQALVAGETDIVISSPVSAKTLLDAGRIRPLAITSLQRDPNFPDVPTLVKSGYPDFVVGAWFGMFGPSGMKPAVADKLHAMIASALKSEEYQKFAKSFMFDITPVSRAQFTQLVKEDKALWSQAIKAAKIAPAD